MILLFLPRCFFCGGTGVFGTSGTVPSSSVGFGRFFESLLRYFSLDDVAALAGAGCWGGAIGFL